PSQPAASTRHTPHLSTACVRPWTCVSSESKALPKCYRVYSLIFVAFRFKVAFRMTIVRQHVQTKCRSFQFARTDYLSTNGSHYRGSSDICDLTHRVDDSRGTW